MRVGIYLDLRNPPQWQRPWPEHYARSLELTDEAERLGAHSVWLSEHHFFEDGYLPQPLTFAAAIAARTQRLRIGTAVYLLNLRPAVQVAEETAVVDILSNGRVDLGVGVGYRVPEFEAFGADITRRYTTIEARCRELAELWRERVTPPPVQQPIPLWGGFFGPRGARLAGRLGMGLLTIEDDHLEAYRSGLAEGGHDPASARMAGGLQVMLADDPEAAWPRVAPHLAHQWNSYRHYMVEGTGRPEPRPIDPERWRQPGTNGEPPRFQVLTPADAAKFARQRTEGSPVEEVFMWASVGGMPDDLTQRNVELISTEFRELVADL